MLRCVHTATRARASTAVRGWSRPVSALLDHQTRRSSSSCSIVAHEAPRSSTARQYMSFYNYTPVLESELPRLRRRMLAIWKRMDVLGRIYISHEGVNAQLTVPVPNVAAFSTSFPALFTREHIFFGAMLDTSDTNSSDRPSASTTTTARGNSNDLSHSEPFHKLDIRIRDQIVRDGFAKGHLDLQHSGASLPPAQWHARLQTRNATNDATTLVLDVRNFYEHDIGRFDGATRIMVDTFRDTFDAVDEILAAHEAAHDGAKPREVLMYCTGGIRCEKVGAYLAQYKGIPNVQKLHGGIVNYMRFLQESEAADTVGDTASAVAASEEGGSANSKPKRIESLFKGKNFVFDQRCIAGARGAAHAAEDVTSDVLGTCFQCGEPCNQHTNCANLMCGGLILQCRRCATQYSGACSVACQQEVQTMRTMTPDALKQYRRRQADKWKPTIPNALSRYSKHIRVRPVPTSMHAQTFCSVSRYVGPLTPSPSDASSLVLDSSGDDDSDDGERVQLNRYVDSMSSALDDEALLAELRTTTVREWPKAIQLIDAPQGKLLRFLVETIGATRVLEIGCFTGYSALCMANGLSLRPEDNAMLLTCDVDAQTMAFAQQYFDRSVRRMQIRSVVSDGMALLESLGADSSSSSIDACESGPPHQQFDLIFVDANKKQYTAYYEAVLAKQLLRAGGLLVFDNTLFRGRVLASASGSASPKERIAQSLARFNAHVAADPRTTQVLLPLWDGLTIVREHSSSKS